MDIAAAGFGFVVSLALLSFDRKKRGEYAGFVETGMINNHALAQGTVIAPDAKYACKEKTTYYIGTRTETENMTIYKNTYTDKSTGEVKEQKVTIPIEHTYEVWNKVGTSRSETNLKLMIDGMENQSRSIVLSNDTAIEWDNKDTVIKNNNKKKINTSYFNNGLYRHVFGKSTGQAITAKYIGSADFVQNKIRSEHFGVNDLLTGIYGAGAVTSVGYMIFSMIKMIDGRR